MHERDWLFFYSIGLILVAGLVFAGSVNNWHERNRHYQAAHELYSGAYDRIAGSASAHQSLITNAEVYRQEWREEQDLAAQRDMAKWAWLMTLVSLAGVGVTTIGVILVALTLVATRDAVSAAKETVREAARSNDTLAATFAAENRPWIRVNAVRFHNFTVNKRESVSFKLEVDVENIGRTPAKAIDLAVDIENFWSGTVLSDSIQSIRRHRSSPDWKVAHGNDCFPNTKETISLSCAFNLSAVAEAVGGAPIGTITGTLGEGVGAAVKRELAFVTLRFRSAVFYSSLVPSGQFETQFVHTIGLRDPEHPDTDQAIAFPDVERTYRPEELRIKRDSRGTAAL